MTRARGIRISDELAHDIAREAEARGISWSAMTTALLTEALKIRRVPGIVMVDGPTGRRAVVAGSGLDVWEIIATWRACGQDEPQLAQHYPWLTQPQLRAALAYYQLYPEEIEARLAREQQWTPERVRRELSFAVPRQAMS
jgi:uncharacterized protein (DUF433 family)